MTAIASPTRPSPAAVHGRRPTVAIVGSGMAGLSCAWCLHPHADVTVFEQDDRIGGHSHTISVSEGGRTADFDTGFMVYNEVTYPLLTRLFAELGVATQPTSMSFSVRHDPAGIEFAGSSVNHLFAQRTNLVRPRYWRFLAQIDRFNREAPAALDDPATATLTLGEYVRQRAYGEDFLQWYLLPMAGAVWSAAPGQLQSFPAAALLRFFHNHGFLGLHTQHPWRTVTGGARSYVAKLTRGFADRIRRATPVACVRRINAGVQLITAAGESVRFDHVVLAGHADQSLGLLADATALERRLLRAFRYSRNDIVVHSDASVMPTRRLAWASWNHRVHAAPGGRPRGSTHYWMNSLQGLSPETNYFVSLNAAADIAPERIHQRMVYHHPLYTLDAILAQAALPGLNHLAPSQATYFCGSYFGHGFHEDALRSGLQAAAALLGHEGWPARSLAAAPAWQSLRP